MLQPARDGLDCPLNVRWIWVAEFDNLQRKRMGGEEYVNGVYLCVALCFCFCDYLINCPAQEACVRFMVRPVGYLTHEWIPVQAFESVSCFLKACAARRRREMRKER